MYIYKYKHFQWWHFIAAKQFNVCNGSCVLSCIIVFRSKTKLKCPLGRRLCTSTPINFDIFVVRYSYTISSINRRIRRRRPFQDSSVIELQSIRMRIKNVYHNFPFSACYAQSDQNESILSSLKLIIYNLPQGISQIHRNHSKKIKMIVFMRKSANLYVRCMKCS